MSGYDARIASSFVGLGYDVFPFEAFDGSGRLKVPDSVKYPDYITDGLGVVARAPIWSMLYRTLSVLDDPQWNVFAAGVGFGSKTVNVALFKAISSVADAEAAHQWSLSYQTTVARTIRQFAGTHHLVDPKWLKLANDAIDRLPPKEKQNDPDGKTPGGGEPRDLLVGADPPATASGVAVEAAGFVPWLLLGLRSVLGVLERFTPKNEVRTTVFWYSGKGQTIDRNFVGNWKPVHIDYMWEGNLRTVHGMWEPVALPHIWHGSGVPWSRWLWAMPHEPWQWCRAMYPTLQCGGPGLQGTGDLCIGELGASTPFDAPEATDGIVPEAIRDAE